MRQWLTAEFWTWLLVAVGVLFRVVEYAQNRSLYMDEKSLLKNLELLPVFDFHTTLAEDQLAAPAFLVIERIMVRLPLPVVPAARFFPLVCGVAAVFLMRSVARRFVLPRGVPIAVGLFALNDWLLYYSSEIKQYSSDLALTLAALFLAAGLREKEEPEIGRRLLTLAGFGAAGVWFSHPLALVLAGVGPTWSPDPRSGSMDDGRPAGRRHPDVGGQFWSLLLGFVPNSEQAAVSLGVVGLCLSADSAALDRRPGTRFLADCESIQQSIVGGHSAGCVHFVVRGVGLFVAGAVAMGWRWRGGVYLLLSRLRSR